MTSRLTDDTPIMCPFMQSADPVDSPEWEWTVTTLPGVTMQPPLWRLQYTFTNGHCCACERACWHVGGPWFCDAHGGNWANPATPVPAYPPVPAFPYWPAVPSEPLKIPQFPPTAPWQDPPPHRQREDDRWELVQQELADIKQTLKQLTKTGKKKVKHHGK